jgi:hypothetical protein
MKAANEHPEQASETPRPTYEPPRVVAYDESALLELIGPAVACASWHPSMPGGPPPTPQDDALRGL